MAITIEFDGRFRSKISNVTPKDITLRGRILKVKNDRIPVMEDRLYDLFYFLERESRHKHGKISIALLVDGDIRYSSTTTDNTADYYADKILGYGMSPCYFFLPRRGSGIPRDDELLIGKEHELYW